MNNMKQRWLVRQQYFCTYSEHFTLLLEPPLEIDSIVPKKEVFSVPQFGQGPFKKINNQCM